MEQSKNNIKKIGFTNMMSVAVIIEDIVVTATVLWLCHKCILAGFTGSMAYLSALIALQQAKSTIVLTAVVNKNKAQNIAGGITYETAVNSTNPDQDCD
jgi:hypothetical protein